MSFYDYKRTRARTRAKTGPHIAAITEGKDDEASSENPTQTEPKG